MIGLPTGTRLTLKVLLAHRFELEQALVELGDKQYLRRRAADLYDEAEGTAVTWKDLYAEPPPLLRHQVAVHVRLTDSSGLEATAEQPDNRREGEASAEDDEVEQTRLMLARLLAAKETQDLTLRARRELKQSALVFVVPTLVVITALFAFAIGTANSGTGETLLAATAGADGAALGALLRLRDEVRFGARIREFISFFTGQIVVGVAAGLFALLAVRSEVLRVGGGTAGLGAFAFAVGFSEAAFIGLVARIGERPAGAAEKKRRDGQERTGP